MKHNKTLIIFCLFREEKKLIKPYLSNENLIEKPLTIKMTGFFSEL